MSARTERLDAIADPVRRVERVAAALAAVETEAVALLAIRDRTIAELRAAGYSYDRLAAHLGVTKARAQQLARRHPHP